MTALTEIARAVASSEVLLLLRIWRGWTLDDYRTWLTAALEDLLLAG